MVGEQPVLGPQRLQDVEESTQVLGPIQVGRLAADLPEHLGKAARPEAVLAPGQVDQQQTRVRHIAAQFGRQRLAHVSHGGKCADNEGHGRRDAVVTVSILPNAAHAHGVLADGHGDPQRRAQLHAHRAHGII